MAISRRALLRRFGAGAAAAVAAPKLHSLAAPLDDDGVDTFRPGRSIRLHRNENVHGPSPKAIAAMADAAKRSVNRYPDLEAESLRRKIAAAHSVAIDQVVLGCGSGEILRAAFDAFAGPQKTILAARPTFEAIDAHARRAGSEIVSVTLSKDWSHDLGGMLSRIDARGGLLYICNPNNPTGSLTRRSDLEAMLRRLPSHVHVLIDEAYHDYVGESSDYASFIDRPVDDARVIVTRSFSKVHGLAGLRVGYAVAASKTARMLATGRLSDGVNVIAVRAAAAALEDLDHVRKSVEKNADDRQEFLNQANARMLRSVDSLTNFVMLNTARPGAGVVEHFARHGILVWGPVPAFETYIRVSLGTPAEMREFWRVWDLMPGGHMMVM